MSCAGRLVGNALARMNIEGRLRGELDESSGLAHHVSVVDNGRKVRAMRVEIREPPELPGSVLADVVRSEGTLWRCAVGVYRKM
jgi:hypothetical protein